MKQQRWLDMVFWASLIKYTNSLVLSRKLWNSEVLILTWLTLRTGGHCVSKEKIDQLASEFMESTDIEREAGRAESVMTSSSTKPLGSKPPGIRKNPNTLIKEYMGMFLHPRMKPAALREMWDWANNSYVSMYQNHLGTWKLLWAQGLWASGCRSEPENALLEKGQRLSQEDTWVG